MADIVCAVNSLTNPSVCNVRGGIRKIYATTYPKINFDSMLTDNTKFDTSNHKILGYTMNTGGIFYEWEFEKNEAFYEFTYSRDSQTYAINIQMFLKSKDSDRTKSLNELIQCCDLVLHIYGYAGEQRVVGIDYDGNEFAVQWETLAVGEHVDRSGQPGSSSPGDQLSFSGQSFFAPIHASVTTANIPLS